MFDNKPHTFYSSEKPLNRHSSWISLFSRNDTIVCYCKSIVIPITTKFMIYICLIKMC